MPFCNWYEKPMKSVSAKEQEQCEENGQQCSECPDSILKGQERHEQDTQ